MIDLRSYQTEALTRVKDAYKNGKRRVLVSLPTGTGKTVVFGHFPAVFRMKKRLLVLAHREELLLQAEQKFRSISPELKVAIERAEERATDDAQVVIASVPTLARSDGGRLSRFNADDFSIIVVDEAHHAVAESYRRIFDYFGLFKPGNARYLVGFTATPRRGDNQGLGSVFEDVCYAQDLRQMIAEGYLCPIRGWRVDTGVSLDGVKVRHGDFVESQLAHAVNTPARNKLVTTSYMRLSSRRSAIVFCVDVQHAKDVCASFVDVGIRAEAVWGEMPREDRRRTLARFSAGEISVLTNCNLLTEGFDEPRVDCVLMARPTKSKLLYAQMVGRGTRLHPEKKDLMVVDVSDNSKTHKLPGLYSLFNLPANMNLSGASVLDVERDIERLNRDRPWVDTSRLGKPQDIHFAAERIEFFNFDAPPELAEYTSHVWYGTAGGYRLNLPEGESLTIEPNLLDTWDVRLCHGAGTRLLAQPEGLSRALAIADTFVTCERPDATKFVERSAGWRDDPPTEKQKELLLRKGIAVPDGLTKGQVSQMISQLFALSGRVPLKRPQDRHV
jgi:superfamily II DNA or RNA helicase